MHRYKLIIEYDGSPFRGWQYQDGESTVQGALEVALAVLNGSPVRSHVAGRTDAGVHATGQVAHVELDKDLPAGKVRDALNALLRPHPIAVIEASRVEPPFHARFSAISRRYLYRFSDRRADLALEGNRVWRVRGAVSLAPLQAAAHSLLGTHDFTTFRDIECQSSSPIKTLDRFDVALAEGMAGPEYHCVLEARSFLHRQVRSMVGSIVQVGQGRWSLEDLAAALAARDRRRCGPVAPPNGLYLTHVGYEDA
jgi:tRNA pseudouridine38-40 synthase